MLSRLDWTVVCRIGRGTENPAGLDRHSGQYLPLLLWMGETDLRGPFDKDRDEVADATFIERTMFFGDNVLNHRAFFIREALGQAVNDSHEGPGFGFFGHCKSFDLTSRRVNGLLAPADARSIGQYPRQGLADPCGAFCVNLKQPVGTRRLLV